MTNMPIDQSSVVIKKHMRRKKEKPSPIYMSSPDTYGVLKHKIICVEIQFAMLVIGFHVAGLIGPRLQLDGKGNSGVEGEQEEFVYETLALTEYM